MSLPSALPILQIRTSPSLRRITHFIFIRVFKITGNSFIYFTIRVEINRNINCEAHIKEMQLNNVVVVKIRLDGPGIEFRWLGGGVEIFRARLDSLGGPSRFL
jgi:hypothetical protein